MIFILLRFRPEFELPELARFRAGAYRNRRVPFLLVPYEESNRGRADF